MKPDFSINLSSLDNIIQETGDIIWRNEYYTGDISEVSEEFDSLYADIANDGKGLVSVIKKWISKDEGFKFKSFEGKIQSIFTKFDNCKNAVDDSVKVFDSYSKRLKKELDTLCPLVENDKAPTLEDYEGDEEVFNKNLLAFRTACVVVWNLRLAYERIVQRLDSSKKVGEQMRLSRPAFQTLLSSLIVEQSSQRALTSAIQITTILGASIDKMSTTLTSDTLKTAQLASRMSCTPMLGAWAIRENAERLAIGLREIKEEAKSSILLLN